VLRLHVLDLTVVACLKRSLVCLILFLQVSQQLLVFSFQGQDLLTVLGLQV